MNWRPLTHIQQIFRLAYHISHRAEDISCAVLVILNGVAELVGLKLDEGPSLLNGHLATVVRILKGLSCRCSW
jgi:hypothetical protein